MSLVFLLGWLSSASLVFFVEFPPVQDYPNHLLRRHVLENIDSEPYSDYIAFDPSFRPNMAADNVLALLRQGFDLKLAGKVLLALELLTINLGALLFLRRFGASVGGALLALHLSGSWLFLKGLMNFGFGIGFGLAWLSVIWWRDAMTARRWILAAGLGLATVASHGFAFLAFSFLTFAGVLVDGKVFGRKALARILAVIPGAVIFALFRDEDGAGLTTRREQVRLLNEHRESDCLESPCAVGESGRDGRRKARDDCLDDLAGGLRADSSGGL